MLEDIKQFTFKLNALYLCHLVPFVSAMALKLAIMITGLTLTSFHSTPIDFPVPPISAKTLFYIQRSNNANTVMYELNMRADKTIDEKDPVQVYWLRYAEKGQRRDLNYIERTLAYGVRCEVTDRNTFMMRFVASKTRWVEIMLNNNSQAEAHMLISNKMSKLKKIFVQVTETSWLPKIEYVEFFGIDIQTQEPTYEKMLI